jgi:ABC-type transport system involved in cytochrome bd biosynthesis fused ATPase/permease subunit
MSPVRSESPLVESYDPKTFHRDFEKTFGYLKPSQFPPIDWADMKQLQMLFPAYKREALAMTEKELKAASGTIEVDNFSLRTPTNDADIFLPCRLVIEKSKRCAVYGENGSGKTSLFEAINKPGKIRHFPKHVHVHHMKELEHNEHADSISVLDTVLCSHPMRRVLLCMEEHLRALIAATEKSERLDKLKENLEYVELELRKLNSATALERAKGTVA